MTVLDYELITVERPGVPPIKFYVRKGSGGEWSDRKAIAECVDRNTYQKPRLGFRVEPGEDWVDCGANVGGFSCLVNALGANLVAAYEPFGPNLVQCHGNLRLNGWDPTVATGYAVVRDTFQGGVAHLNIQPKPIQQRRHSMHFARKGAYTTDVPVIRFSEIAQDRCVKMNIEGEEIGILQDLQEPLPLKIVTEWSFDVEDRLQVLRDVLAKLEGWYTHVRVSRTLPDQDRWTYYPPNCFIYAWGRK